VAAGLVTGESPGPVGLGAVAVALVAITLISEPGAPEDPQDVAPGLRHGGHARRHVRSRGRHARRTRRWAVSRQVAARLGRPGVVEALGSGLGFGGFYLLLARTTASAGLWPVLSARAASALVFTGVALLARDKLLPARPDRRVVVLAGLLDAVAAVAFLAATHRGLLAVVAVLSSLYPAATIALAALFDHERCTRVQWAGLGLAVISVSVLTVG
jgi:hypothetical protein